MWEARFCGTRLWSDERKDRYRRILLYWFYIPVRGFTVSMGPTMLLATLRDYVREHSEVLRPGRHRIYTWNKHGELHAIRASEGWIRYHMCNSRQSRLAIRSVYWYHRHIGFSAHGGMAGRLVTSRERCRLLNTVIGRQLVRQALHSALRYVCKST